MPLPSVNESDPLGIVGELVTDKYRIEAFVDQGGFAAVYKAVHTIWNKPVAIKFFSGLSAAPVAQRPQLQEAFIREGALLTELSSQSAAIVQARDVGSLVTPSGQWMPFIVLEWLEGLPLDELLLREQEAGLPPWTMSETYALVAQVAQALDIAHRRGIAHRDIKPANLFLLGDDARTGGVAVKVLDFGVAKIMAETSELQVTLVRTGAGASAFTPNYGAPEQFDRSYGTTGPWTDVYALALVAVELLTSRAPLEGADFVQLAVASANQERRPTPRALGANVPDAVERVFERALAVRPTERYERAGEFLAALGSAAGGFSTDPAPPLTRSTTRPPAVGSGGPHPLSVSRPPSGPGPRLSVGIGLAAVVVLGAAGFRALRSGNSNMSPPAHASPSAMPLASAPIPEPTCASRMVKIPGGQYFRGSDAKDVLENQRPAHSVTLDGYCIDLFEVTAREYKACADIGKCKRAATEVEWPKITVADRKLYSTLCTFGLADKQDYPINCVSWEMADIFCAASGKRLPTEAEWEYATRGPDGRVYPWGDSEPTAKHLNACGTECAAWGRKNRTVLTPLFPEDDGYATLAPVGRFDAGRSRFGPYDVVGNVWEWVSDWYAEYTPEAKKNPLGPEHGERKVIRGGAWNGSYAAWLHPAFRYAQVPNALSHGIGFRCAKTLAK